MISIPTLAPAYTSGRFNPNSLFTNPVTNPGSGETSYNGLWYDPSDLTVEKAAWRRNLFTYTEDLTNSVWTATSTDLTVTPDSVLAPNSAIAMASLLTFGSNASAGFTSTSQTITANVVYTGSIHLKRGNTDWAMVTLSTATASVRAAVWVNLATGAVGTQDANGTGMNLVSATVSNLQTEGWFRISVRAYHTSTVLRLNVYMVTGDGVTTRVPNATVYAYGPQLERRTFTSVYQPISDFYTEFRAAFPNHTLYQDALSWPPVPVTKFGERVGLALTRPSPGPLLGSELISNPSFTGGTSGWVAGSGVTVSTFTATNGIATLTALSPDTSPRYVATITGLRVNQLYRLQLVLGTGDTGTGNRNLVWTATSNGTGGTTYSNNTATSERLVVASASTMYVALSITTASDGATFNVDSVSLRELQGDNAYTVTSTQRPSIEARENLFTNTEQANDSDWKKTNVTVSTAPALAPDNNYTADLIAETVTSGTHSLYFNTASVISGVYYTYSVYVKKGTGATAPDWIQLQFTTAGFGSGDSYRTNFNVSNGAVGAWGAAIVAVGSTPQLNGYFRVSITAQATATSTTAGAYLTFNNNDANAAAAPSYAGATTADVFVWGQQLNIGQTPKPYQRVVSDTDYADIDAPRGFQFDGVDDNLETPILTWATTQLSAFIGERRFNTGEGGLGAYFDRNGRRSVMSTNTPNNAVRTFIDYSTTDLNVLSTANSVALGTYNVISVVWSSGATSASVAMRCNGVPLSNDGTSTSGTGTQTSDANTAIRIGGRYLGDRTFNGVICQVMVRDVATEEAQVQALESFIAQKLGVTL